MIVKAKIDICKESGEAVNSLSYSTELGAQNDFDGFYKGKLALPGFDRAHHLSEFYTGGTVGFVRLYAIDEHGMNYMRRELFINV